jgi:hypothetical protein
MSDDSDIEKMIKANGADKAPRVSEQSIWNKIADTKYIEDPATALTVCIIRVENGFAFIGHSAAASPENYNQEIGRKISFDNAFKQIWSHEGYLLKDRLHRGHTK